MSAPRTGPCVDWATAAQAKICGPCSGLTDDQINVWLPVASEILFALSGRRFSGSCSLTVRPCSQGSIDYLPVGFKSPDLDWARGWTRNPWGYGCFCSPSAGSCGCQSEIILEFAPITSITSVKVDGVTLDPARYRLDENLYLVRLPNADGSSASWPCGQDMTLASTELNTFEVSYTYGVAPPVSGLRAAGELACHLALACVGSEECRLPTNVTNVTRQGVSLSLLDPQLFLDRGKTGLYLVDLFLHSVNPGGLIRPPYVWSPDYQARTRRIGT